MQRLKLMMNFSRSYYFLIVIYSNKNKTICKHDNYMYYLILLCEHPLNGLLHRIITNNDQVSSSFFVNEYM